MKTLLISPIGWSKIVWQKLMLTDSIIVNFENIKDLKSKLNADLDIIRNYKPTQVIVSSYGGGYLAKLIELDSNLFDFSKTQFVLIDCLTDFRQIDTSKMLNNRKTIFMSKSELVNSYLSSKDLDNHFLVDLVMSSHKLNSNGLYEHFLDNDSFEKYMKINTCLVDMLDTIKHKTIFNVSDSNLLEKYTYTVIDPSQHLLMITNPEMINRLIK
jgi:hypothetical protein